MRARSGELELTKLSYGAFPAVGDRYRLLRSGAALGHGCGPLVVAREEMSLAEAVAGRARDPGPRHDGVPPAPPRCRRAGRGGGAALRPDPRRRRARATSPAGLVIHESRFTYEEHGLVKVADLGEWWEGETGLPVPLAGICARADLDEETRAARRGGDPRLRRVRVRAPDGEPRVRARARAGALRRGLRRAHRAVRQRVQPRPRRRRARRGRRAARGRGAVGWADALPGEEPAAAAAAARAAHRRPADRRVDQALLACASGRRSPLGLAAVPLVVAEHLCGGSQRRRPPRSSNSPSSSRSGRPLLGRVRRRVPLVLGAAPRARVARAYRARRRRSSSRSRPARRSLAVLPGARLARRSSGSRCPRSLVEDATPRRALRRGVELARADFAHALGGLVRARARDVPRGGDARGCAPQPRPRTRASSRSRLAQGVAAPRCCFLGSALLYVDQDGACCGCAARRRRWSHEGAPAAAQPGPAAELPPRRRRRRVCRRATRAGGGAPRRAAASLPGGLSAFEQAPCFRRGARRTASADAPPWYGNPAVPIYEYKCPNGHVFELFQRFADAPAEACEVCGAVARREGALSGGGALQGLRLLHDGLRKGGQEARRLGRGLVFGRAPSSSSERRRSSSGDSRSAEDREAGELLLGRVVLPFEPDAPARRPSGCACARSARTTSTALHRAARPRGGRALALPGACDAARGRGAGRQRRRLDSTAIAGTGDGPSSRSSSARAATFVGDCMLTLLSAEHRSARSASSSTPSIRGAATRPRPRASCCASRFDELRLHRCRPLRAAQHRLRRGDGAPRHAPRGPPRRERVGQGRVAERARLRAARPRVDELGESFELQPGA